MTTSEKLMMSGKDLLINFSIDLLSNSKKHIYFLRSVHSSGLSLRCPSKFEFSRYQKWLALLASEQANNNGTDDTDDEKKEEMVSLIPPLDIAWLWHCHRLAPVAYERACVDLFGHLLDFPCSAFQFATTIVEQNMDDDDDDDDEDEDNCEAERENESIAATKQKWDATFPDEPYVLDLKNILVDILHADDQWCAEKHVEKGGVREYGVLSGFDVIDACERQSSFLWQVTQPKFSHAEFLLEGISNYHKFLTLMKLNPKEFVIPTYQVRRRRRGKVFAKKRKKKKKNVCFCHFSILY
jgi:hypothetical protein